MAKYKVEKADAELAAAAGVPEGTVVIIKKRKKKNRRSFSFKPKKVGKHVGNAAESVAKAFGF